MSGERQVQERASCKQHPGKRVAKGSDDGYRGIAKCVGIAGWYRWLGYEENESMVALCTNA